MTDNSLLENISKLNTFIHMNKSNEALGIYVEKLTNGRSQSLKFVPDFDSFSLDLLYTSLQMMNKNNYISKVDYNKLDKRELAYYFKKVKGISFFKKQVPSLKTEEVIINYLSKALANGEYILNFNNTIKFNNGLVLDALWTIDFSSFLINSLNNNINLAEDGLIYYFNTVEIPKIVDNDITKFIKSIKQYEYSVKRKDCKRLSYQDIKYLIDKLSIIDKYNFKKLQVLNSELEKKGFTLSVNKKADRKSTRLNSSHMA